MMDDLISRQAAIETVEKWFFNLDDNRMPKEVLLELPSAQQTTCKYWDTESDFCALYRPSAQPEQRWIPWDSGRLPDDSGTYIVTAYDGVQERVTFAKYQKRLKRWELTGARAYWRVLAWMPLPEPYEERREE